MSSTPVSANLLFGIKWQLDILASQSADSNIQLTAKYDSYDNESLQIEFDIQQTVKQNFWYADISIYNLNDATENLIIGQGQLVRLSAGFINGQQYGVIFEGTLLQPIWERVDGINYKLTLHCIVGIIESTNNFCNINLAAGISQRQMIQQMAANARNPITNQSTPVTLQDINDVPASGGSSRGTVIFGNPNDYFTQIASTNGFNYWSSNLGANIRNLRQQTTNVPTVIYGPGTGLIGTPQATQDGVTANVLLDPRPILGGQMQLTPDTTIKQQPFVQGQFPTVLDQNGLYSIVALRHIGSSRGGVWMTQITAIATIGSKALLFNL